METEAIAEGTPSSAPAAAESHGAKASAHAPEAEPECEPDRPKIGMLAITVATTIALLVVLVIGVSEIFRSVVNGEVSSKQLEHQSSELRELRAEEQAKLSRYQWVSRKDGVVRIPVDRARELTLAAYRSPPPPPPAAPAAPEAPPAAPAPPAGATDAAHPPTGTQ